MGSFRRWVQAQGWIRDDPLAGIERRPQVRDDTAPIRYEQLHALWTREDVHVREKTLWRMLYETAARTNEVLALNIEDLDVGPGGLWSGAKAATAKKSCGRREPPASCPAIWAAASGDRCSSLTADPTRRPRFPDVCPDTGRGRLSYQQAWALFRKASGWTLHQLRHSALTHLGERGVGAPLLKAKSRHRSLRSLDRYVRPGIEAVAALTAEHDPGRRYPA